MTFLVSKEETSLAVGDVTENLTRFLRSHNSYLKNHRTREILAILHARSFRLTLARLVVIDTICCIDKEFDTAELCREVAIRADYIGPASIYRTVKLLTELNIVSRVYNWQANSRYLLNLQHQHWAACQNCGKQIKFTDCELGETIRKFEATTGFRVSNHYLTLVGICVICQNLMSLP